ncbi:hypothetical protein [Streptomyces sp. MP131-18]|uniref:WD40 repeat domain-containing protein n=1 Tax=Streptomyces sp. MP131-18 TaxID=1857892 RepID=UPI00097BDC57|nr:hypothetical protein [Streptomyces sp. MP131-18]ONK14368.1 putative protein containing caspase domain protein [Streptomyces sp. MP131-18]
MLHDYPWEPRGETPAPAEPPLFPLTGDDPLVLATDCAMDRLYVVDAGDGERVPTSPALDAKLCAEQDVVSIVLSPDRALIALLGIELHTGLADCGLRPLDVQSAAEIIDIDDTCRGTKPAYVGSLAFSPDSRVIATGHDDGTVRFRDAESGDPVGEPLTGHAPEEGIDLMAFNEDGTRLATHSTSDNSIRVWDVPS